MVFLLSWENWNMNILRIGCSDISNFTILTIKGLEAKFGKLISKLSNLFTWKKTMKLCHREEFMKVQAGLKK